MPTDLPDDFDIKRVPLIGWLIAAVGPLLAVACMMALLGITRRQPNPPVDIAVIVVGLIALPVGIYLIRNPGTYLRFSSSNLEIVTHRKVIPWSDVAHVDVIETSRDNFNANHSATVLILKLTPDGLSRQKGTIQDSGLASMLRPDEHVALRTTWWWLRKTVGGIDQLVHEIQVRVSEARGEEEPPKPPALTIDASLIPDPNEKPVKRDKPHKNRIYIHRCGTAVNVSGRSLRGLCNPMSYTSGTACTRCGAVPLNEVWWEDTGETIRQYRRRLFRHLPIGVKIFNVLVLPLCSAALHYFYLPSHANIGETEHLWLSIGMGLVLAYLLLLLTPLSAIAPYAIGYQYWRFK